jgi:hypothetical protein
MYRNVFTVPGPEPTYDFTARYSDCWNRRDHSEEKSTSDSRATGVPGPVPFGLSVNNLFDNDVPPMVFEPDRLDKGGLGFDERRIYVSLRLKV